jgi:polysaccharide deacetylase 2 family uncharacterized protein YibQ
MPKRKKKSSGAPRLLFVLAALALALFIGGEAFLASRSGSWRDALSRFGGSDTAARQTMKVGREIKAGLTAVGVSADSIRDSVTENGPATVRWRVGLRPEASLIQANYAVSRRVQDVGGKVLGGRESRGPHGEATVTLLIASGGRPTHEIVLARMPRLEKGDEKPEPPETRLAIVAYGFGDDVEAAKAFFALPGPFAVAIVPGARTSGPLFRAAHAASREVVLHLPLEPVNYPQLDPGPGTLLVTMKPARITGIVRRYLDEGQPVVAVANFMGSLATQDMAVMGAVYQELKRRHLPFVHVQPAAGAVCRPLAADVGVVYDEPGDVIDAEARMAKEKALDARWTAVLKEARARGRMAVWIRATPQTRAWLPRALAPKRLEGVSLVPFSSVIRRPATL